MVAAAIALSYLEIQIGAFGGSIDFVMVPLVLLAVRRGPVWGLAAGLVAGTLKFFLAGGYALNWQSMLLDYSLAYMLVGLAGLMKGRKYSMAVGAVIGGLGRLIIHFISGITIYAEWMPEEFLGLTMTNVWFYSILYNGLYMIPDIILAAIICTLIAKPLDKYVPAKV